MQDVLDLIEKPMGVIDLLDEQCKFPRVGGASCNYCSLLQLAIKPQPTCLTLCHHLPLSPAQATNADYANRLYQSPTIKESKRFSKPKLSQTAFTIDHYAGGVRLLLHVHICCSMQRLLHIELPVAICNFVSAVSQVSYSTDSFLVKNRDFVVAEHQLLLENSGGDFIKVLFPPELDAEASQVLPHTRLSRIFTVTSRGSSCHTTG